MWLFVMLMILFSNFVYNEELYKVYIVSTAHTHIAFCLMLLSLSAVSNIILRELGLCC